MAYEADVSGQVVYFCGQCVMSLHVFMASLQALITSRMSAEVGLAGTCSPGGVFAAADMLDTGRLVSKMATVGEEKRCGSVPFLDELSQGDQRSPQGAQYPPGTQGVRWGVAVRRKGAQIRIPAGAELRQCAAAQLLLRTHR